MNERSEIVVDLQRIIENYKAYKTRLFKNQRVMAVLKANAYGHGASRVAWALSEVGVYDFAVATFDEAAELRKCGIDGQILILGYTPPHLAREIASLDLAQTVYSADYAASLLARGARINAHISLNTGMNRAGLDTLDPDACAAQIRALTDKFDVKGIYTHLSCADDEAEENFTRGQLERFFGITNGLCGEYELHFGNSAAGLVYNDTRCSLVRLGIMLYGLRPSRTFSLLDGVAPALEWRSVISSLRTVERGESVGYGRGYVASRKMRVATVSTGYADGYFRALSNRGAVVLHGRRASIVGRVCMDQLMIDVTDIPDTAEGDSVTLIGDGYTADDMARDADTINYEIVTRIAPRVTKTYK